jgi:hypothetical protein
MLQTDILPVLRDEDDGDRSNVTRPDAPTTPLRLMGLPDAAAGARNQATEHAATREALHHPTTPDQGFLQQGWTGCAGCDDGARLATACTPARLNNQARRVIT